MIRALPRLALAAALSLPLVSFAQQAAPAPTPGVPAPNPAVPGQGNIPGQGNNPAQPPGIRPPGSPGGIRPPGAPGGGNNNDIVDGPIEAPPPTDLLLRTGMAMPNASIIKVILPIYQQLTGKRVVLDTNIADNNVRIVVAGPITKEDLIDFIERSLLTNGFAFVPTNKDNTVKLINALGGQPLRAQGGRVFIDPATLPVTDAVVTYVMKLEYIKSEEAARIFPQIIQLNSYGAIAAVDNASAVIITDDVAIVRQLIELAKIVDVPSAQVSTKWFELERADAEKAAEFLAEVLDTGADSTPARAIRAGGDAPAAGAAPAGAAPGSASASPGTSEGPSVKIVADTRRNAILAVARPLDMQYIDSLIKEYDSPSKVKTFLKRPLKFIVASELLEPLQNALERENAGEGGGGGAVSSGGGSSRASTNATSRGSGLGSRGSSSGSSFGGGSSGFGGGSNGFGGGGSSSGGGSLLQAGDAPPAAESVVIGKTLLVADNERNAIIVSGPPESIRLVEEIIEQLDERPRQVLLSTVIGQMTLGDDREYGLNILKSLSEINANENLLGAGSLGAINFPGRTTTSPGTGTNPGTSTTNLIDIEDLLDPTNLPALSGLNLYGKIGEDLRVYMKLLENQNRFRVLQRPVIFTANNRQAVISSGQRIAVPTNSFTSGATVGATQSTNIEYRDVVLRLEVVPLINSENEVTLRIAQVNDKVVGTQTIDSNAVPIIGTEELETTVTVTNGQTVVLGGLITERTERTVNGVPILIQIPLIKHLFGTTKEEKTREELMIFIQPKILDTNEQILSENLNEVRRIPRGEEIVEFAVPEYPEIKARAEAEAAAAEAAAQGKPARKRPTGGLLHKMKLFGD